MTKEIKELLEKVHNMNSYDTYSRLYDEISLLEQQLANLKHNYEMQEIMIDDYKKRIEELEAPKSCYGCKYNSFGCDSCTLEYKACKRTCYDYYEPKESE